MKQRQKKEQENKLPTVQDYIDMLKEQNEYYRKLILASLGNAESNQRPVQKAKAPINRIVIHEDEHEVLLSINLEQGISYADPTLEEDFELFFEAHQN